MFLILVVVLCGCLEKRELGKPELQGYEVLRFGKPRAGELTWRGGDLVERVSDTNCEAWVVRLK